MTEWAAITVVGADRPGIVAGVTQVLFEHGCNLEDSSATILRDAFAMILIAKLPEPANLAGLQAALTACAASLGVSCEVRPLGTAAAHPATAGAPYLLTVYGADQPGIVYRVTARLAELCINISDVATRVTGHADRPVYLMVLDLSVPESVAQERLEAALADLRTALDVDITLRPVDEATL